MRVPNRSGSLELSGENLVKLLFGVLILIVIATMVISLISIFSNSSDDWSAKRANVLLANRFNALMDEGAIDASTIVQLPQEQGSSDKTYHIIGFGTANTNYGGESNGYSTTRPKSCGSDVFCLCVYKYDASLQPSAFPLVPLACQNVDKMSIKDEDKIDVHIVGNNGPTVARIHIVRSGNGVSRIIVDRTTGTASTGAAAGCTQTLPGSESCIGTPPQATYSDLTDPTWQKANPNFKGCITEERGFCVIRSVNDVIAAEKARLEEAKKYTCSANSDTGCKGRQRDGVEADMADYVWAVQHNGMTLCLMLTDNPEKDGGKFCQNYKVDVRCNDNSDAQCKNIAADGSDIDLTNETWLSFHSTTRAWCVLRTRTSDPGSCVLLNSNNAGNLIRAEQAASKKYYCATTDLLARGCAKKVTQFTSAAESDTAWARSHPDTCMARTYRPTNDGERYGYECATPGPVP